MSHVVVIVFDDTFHKFFVVADKGGDKLLLVLKMKLYSRYRCKIAVSTPTASARYELLELKWPSTYIVPPNKIFAPGTTCPLSSSSELVA